jgi:hypothetical protein
LLGGEPFSIAFMVRRETGKEQVVKVHSDEGAASHIGPESCAGAREDTGEALTGERIGQPLSREIAFILGADSVINEEGKTTGRVIASAPPARRGRRPWHVWTLLVREPGDLQPDHSEFERMVRVGKARSRSR